MMHKAECLIKHGKTKNWSSTRSLDYLTMEQAAQGISDGIYTYKHRCEGGVDIHDIVVKKSRFRILLYYIGTICLLMTVCRILLSKETLGLGSLWSISFAGVIAKWLRCDPVKKGGCWGSVPYYSVSLCTNECLVVNFSLRLCLDLWYFRSIREIPRFYNIPWCWNERRCSDVTNFVVLETTVLLIPQYFWSLENFT